MEQWLWPGEDRRHVAFAGHRSPLMSTRRARAVRTSEVRLSVRITSRYVSASLASVINVALALNCAARSWIAALSVACNLITCNSV
jgi:hypothetical protein